MLSMLAGADDGQGGHHKNPWSYYVYNDMETLFISLALCEGNPVVTGRFHSEKASNAELVFFFAGSLNELLNNQ